MPVLHFRITSNEENIDISRQIHSQNFTWVRAIVQSVPSASGTKPLNGGLNIECGFLQGYEMTSNVAGNRLLIGMDEDKCMNAGQYVQNFNAEDIKNRFHVSVFDFTNTSHATFGTGPGELTSVDLFFEFTEMFPVSY